ncbi:hypothetical protein MP228_000887 [Amoeboaphelidium protococcarum]|nr:hypothetical protein MP228_000887 [Amoeboaphelidium protococcarum]
MLAVRYACDPCIRGHRAYKCRHTDRTLRPVRQKGRPQTQCAECKKIRNRFNNHIKCTHQNTQQQQLSSDQQLQSDEVDQFPQFDSPQMMDVDQIVDELQNIPAETLMSRDCSLHLDCSCRGGICCGPSYNLSQQQQCDSCSISCTCRNKLYQMPQQQDQPVLSSQMNIVQAVLDAQRCSCGCFKKLSDCSDCLKDDCSLLT